MSQVSHKAKEEEDWHQASSVHRMQGMEKWPIRKREDTQLESILVFVSHLDLQYLPLVCLRFVNIHSPSGIKHIIYHPQTTQSQYIILYLNTNNHQSTRIITTYLY